MSIFGSIMSKIFGHAAEPTASPASTAAPTATAAAAPASLQASAAPASATPAPTAEPVDVAAVLERMQAGKGALNWRTSIVDLLKVLDLDSSLEARKTLAGELHYTGDTSDSATMNMWLHHEVMAQLAQNGGKVPDDLKG